ncbi:12879_t:CDS:2, partial [Gigaspora rosea]
ISHAIKRWVKIGHKIEEEEDIENAIKDLSGTHVSHLEPNRDKEKEKLGRINRISNWHEFTWPETGEDTVYICTRALPEFGKWNKIAPGQIDKIAKKHTFENHLQVIQHTHNLQNHGSYQRYNENNQRVFEVEKKQNEEMDIDPIFLTSKSNNVFVRGWALPESLKVNQKGPTKRLTEQIKELLMIMFHTGTTNPRLKMNANKMHEELLKKVSEG